MNLTTLMQAYVFVLAGFVGFLVIARVPPLLHPPLMSATNAISGISRRVAGRRGGRTQRGEPVLGTVAVTAATINVVGGSYHPEDARDVQGAIAVRAAQESLTAVDARSPGQRATSSPPVLSFSV